jgi:hypothetical protein
MKLTLVLDRARARGSLIEEPVMRLFDSEEQATQLARAHASRNGLNKSI